MGVIALVQQLQLGTRVSSGQDEFTAPVKQHKMRAFYFSPAGFACAGECLPVR